MIRKLQSPQYLGTMETSALDLLAERLNSGEQTGRSVNEFVRDRFWPFDEKADTDVVSILEPVADIITSLNPSVTKIGFHATKETVLPYGLPEGARGWNFGKRRYYEVTSDLPPQYLLGRPEGSRIVAAIAGELSPSGHLYQAPEDRINPLMDSELAMLGLSVIDMEPNVLYELGPRVLYRQAQSYSSRHIEKATLAVSTYTSIPFNPPVMVPHI